MTTPEAARVKRLVYHMIIHHDMVENGNFSCGNVIPFAGKTLFKEVFYIVVYDSQKNSDTKILKIHVEK